MVVDGTIGLFLGSIGLGAAHGVLPDHGWPVAALYAINKERTWFHGFASGFVLGFGHLISSITVVFVYFWALTYFDLTEIHGLEYIAGGLLIILGVREYLRGGHSHGHGEQDDTGHGPHGSFGHDGDGQQEQTPHTPHVHDNDEEQQTGEESVIRDLGKRFQSAVPFVGPDEAKEHTQSLQETADQRGLYGIALFSFALGFAHNEEIEIIAICTGSTRCLELMAAYALAVLCAVILMTLLLVAGYETHRERVEAHQHHIPTVTAVVLIIMGIGFIAGVF